MNSSFLVPLRQGREPTTSVAEPREEIPSGWKQLGIERKRRLLEQLLRERDGGVGARKSGVLADPAALVPQAGKSRIDFSLLFFSSNERDESSGKYDLLLQGSQLADKLGFKAVWMPERHFHPVGGLFPNPSVIAAAVAVLTKQIRLRAGSVVAPLHQAVRIAEEWSVVDNLSNGRVDLSFARGWNPKDFVLSPGSYRNDNTLMASQMDTVCKLWKGEGIRLSGHQGQISEVRIFPRPVQSELTCWMTCMGGAERFVEAGQRGCNILTMLFNQTIDELKKKIEVYRAARDKANGPGIVTLMLHAFVHPDMDFARRTVREPFLDFIRSTINLHQQGAEVRGIDVQEDEKERMAQFAYERYFRNAALFGPADGCAELIEKLIAAGVNEVACQIDFGVDRRSVLESISHLGALKDRFAGDLSVLTAQGSGS